MQRARVQLVSVREDAVGLGGVGHVLLNAEVVHGQIEVQRRRHADRRQIGRAMRAGPHVVQLGEVRDPPQVRDPARVHDRRADVIDELLADQLLAVVDRREHLAHRQRRGRVLADQPEARPAARPAPGPPSRTGDGAPAPCPAAPPRSASAGGGRRAAGGCRRRARGARARTAPARRSGTSPSRNASPAACPSRPARS